MAETGTLTRTETMPEDGWCFDGEPVEWWANEAIRDRDASLHLATRIAELEGVPEGHARVDRALALEKEARAAV